MAQNLRRLGLPERFPGALMGAGLSRATGDPGSGAPRIHRAKPFDGGGQAEADRARETSSQAFPMAPTSVGAKAIDVLLTRKRRHKLLALVPAQLSE
jgi:hypothetical protein